MSETQSHDVFHAPAHCIVELNGCPIVLRRCPTVNDIKVEVCRLLYGYHPPQVTVSANGKELSSDNVSPTHVKVMICKEQKSRSFWASALKSYNSNGDLHRAAVCAKELRKFDIREYRRER